MEALSPKELLTFLHSELKSLYEGYLNYVLATTGSILILIGWFITSENAQKLVSKTGNKVFMFDIILCSIFFIELIVSIGIYKDFAIVGNHSHHHKRHPAFVDSRSFVH